jgi:thiamine kinase-like enzyme
MTPPLPSHPEEITAELLTEVLRDGGHVEGTPDVEVTAVTVEPFAAGTAFLGLLARLDVTYADPDTPLPRRLIAKTPTNDPGGRAVGEMLNVWKREAMFYGRLAHLIDTPVPTCRANLITDDRSLLLLDDLHPAQPGDQVAGADATQARSAVVALAELHAPFWGQARTDELRWVPGLDTSGTADALQAAMASAIPRFVDRFGHLLPDESVHWLHRFVPRLGEWRTDLLDRPLTIAHADYRLENMLFDDDGQVTVIDWQTAMYTGGPTDLSFFLATNLDIDLRRRHEQDLVATYIDTLHDRGVSPTHTGHVWDDYRTAHLWWIGMLANNLSSIDTPDERSKALFEAMLTRLHTAAVDVNSGDWLG